MLYASLQVQSIRIICDYSVLKAGILIAQGTIRTFKKNWNIYGKEQMLELHLKLKRQEEGEKCDEHKCQKERKRKA